MTRGHACIGTSGWIYRHWGKDVFYPSGLPQKKWLSYYCQTFDTVEINSTFYNLPGKKVYENWYQATPENFLFVVKANRFVTHMKKLNEPETTMQPMLENMSGLREKLGPILFQLPPFWNLDETRLRNFLAYLRQQDIIANLRVVFEIRNDSWKQTQVLDLFREHNAALCFSDWPGLTIESPMTADFVYLRRHGPSGLYSSEYSEKQLENIAQRMKTRLDQGRDVYVYFNNDAYGYAVRNAVQLKQLLSE